MSPSLTNLVRKHASERPNDVAVIAKGGHLSFRDLVGRAEALARSLGGLTARAESPVLVSGHRSGETVAALVGALLSGRPFLIVDPAAPDAVLRKLLERVEPAMALADGTLAARLRDLGVHTMGVGEAAAAGGNGRALTATAYLVTTSGSTGDPKVIAVSRANLDAYSTGLIDRLGLAEPTSFASVTPLWTDLGHTAVFGALATGGTLHLVDEGTAVSPREMAAYLARHHVDFLKTTPSHLSALLAGENLRPPTRTTLLLGGERLPWALVDRIRSLTPGVRVFNHYGPAECTVGAAMGEVPATRSDGTASVPVGHALRGSELRIVGDDGVTVPAGESGEIQISGAGVALGYLDGGPAPRSLTLSADGRDWYPTGDLGRLLPDGSIEVQGRLDRQIKVRGHRVEPGEVEQALLETPGVARAHAFGLRTEDHVLDLVAAVVPLPGSGATADGVMGWLKERLPGAVLPSRVVLLDELPLTPAGKVDEQSIAEAPGSAGGDGPSKTEEGHLVEELFEDLLGRRLSPSDSLLDNGFNSIVAIRFLARLNSEAGVEIPLHLLFEHPTIAEIARLVDGDLTSTP
ncbi:hypothetical protein CQJ94_11335 [Glycomyces fuscus]|nr:hypothetical protein CQJ94_11335 [Glycomyces fuscus]